MSIWEYANPKKFIATTTPLLPWVFGAAIGLMAVGLIWGFFFTPDAVGFGSNVKIIYVHVPAALMAINAWLMMVVASVIWVIRRHHVSALAAKAAAPVGLVMTVIALITGAIWGQVTWTTWWVWDARLTSFFVLFLFYLGYIALWSAIDDPDTAADLTTVLVLVGSIFAILSRYAVLFWGDQGLHQDATFSADAETNISTVYWIPSVISMGGFVLLFIALVLLRTQTEIRGRRARALETRAHAAEGRA